MVFWFCCSPWSQGPMFRDYRIRESCLTPCLSLSALGEQKCMCVWEKSLFCVSAMTVPLHLPSSQSHKGTWGFGAFWRAPVGPPHTLGSAFLQASCSKPTGATVCDILRAELRAVGNGKEN